ncbi:MAG: hypothetical protein ABI992_09005 [Chthoniobacterales bacterium]
MKLLAVGAVSALALSAAFAQTTKESTTTTTAGGDVTTSSSTTTLDGSGTITTYTPGQEFVEFKTTSSTSPVKYYYTPKTTVVDSTGAVVDMSLLRPELPVRYTYVKEGDRMVVSKITVEKPLAEIKKVTETTTTTTTHK